VIGQEKEDELAWFVLLCCSICGNCAGFSGVSDESPDAVLFNEEANAFLPTPQLFSRRTSFFGTVSSTRGRVSA